MTYSFHLVNGIAVITVSRSSDNNKRHYRFDVDNDELIATISKAFDGFSDFKKIEDQK
jgi:hypothetical protein